MNSNKDKFLGMPLGTASAKLRKSLLFSMAQQLGRDICFQCQKVIETIEEFSIEHKNPWLNVNKELFFDLKNIAFSHLSCNARAGKKARKGQKAEHGTYSRYNYWKCRCEQCTVFNAVTKTQRMKNASLLKWQRERF